MKGSKLKQILIPALTLFLVCVVVTGLLAFTNSLTAAPIAEMAARTEENARREVLGKLEFDRMEKTDDETVFAVYDEFGGNPVAYVFSETVKGYGGEMNVMVGIDMNGAVTGVKLVSHSETVGLGAKTALPSFTDQFAQSEKTDKFTVGGNIDAVTGATISSKAVTSAVNAALERFNAINGGGKDNG